MIVFIIAKLEVTILAGVSGIGITPSPTGVPAIDNNIAPRKIRACITSHPYNGALQFTRMRKPSHGNIFDPIVFNICPFFCK